MCSVHGDVVALAFDSKRYIGAQIGIHDPHGNKVGTVGHTRNLEYVVIAGPRRRIDAMTTGLAAASVD
jgi:adenine-specific DNA-methyltransferase